MRLLRLIMVAAIGTITLPSFAQQGSQRIIDTIIPFSNRPDYFEVPLDTSSHLIYVKAVLNGKVENFILDSGCGELLLNSEYFADDSTLNCESDPLLDVRSFEWQGLHIDNITVRADPIEHLDKTGTLAGLIGYNIFADYEITYDYQKQKLLFLRIDAKGEPLLKKAGEEEPSCIVPFKMEGHVPVFTMTLGSNPYKIGLDCGAGTNLINSKHFSALKSNCGKIQYGLLLGVAKGYELCKFATLKSVKICNEIGYKNMQFVFGDRMLNSVKEAGMIMDGLVGYQFLKQHRTTINYKKGEMRIYKNSK